MDEPNIRQLAQLLHTVLNARRYTRRSDLVYDFKERCARFRPPLAYDSASIEAAINMVEGAGRRRDIPRGEPEHELPHIGRPTEHAFDGPTIGRHDAVSILATIRKRLKAPELRPKVMPAAPPDDPRVAFERDRARAALALVNAIVESDATCEALEATIGEVPGTLLEARGDDEPVRVDARAHLGDGDRAAREAGARAVETRPCPDCKQSRPTCESQSGPFISIACRVCGHVYAVRDAEPAREWTRARHRSWKKS